MLWKAQLPGVEAKASPDQYQSSTIVLGDRVFLTASYWLGMKADPKSHPEHHVVSYSTADGKMLWDSKVEPNPWLLSDLRGGYTATTPAAGFRASLRNLRFLRARGPGSLREAGLAEGDQTLQVRRPASLRIGESTSVVNSSLRS